MGRCGITRFFQTMRPAAIIVYIDCKQIFITRIGRQKPCMILIRFGSRIIASETAFLRFIIPCLMHLSSPLWTGLDAKMVIRSTNKAACAGARLQYTLSEYNRRRYAIFLLIVQCYTLIFRDIRLHNIRTIGVSGYSVH